jgi:hypothetical protein
MLQIIWNMTCHDEAAILDQIIIDGILNKNDCTLHG